MGDLLTGGKFSGRFSSRMGGFHVLRRVQCRGRPSDRITIRRSPEESRDKESLLRLFILSEMQDSPYHSVFRDGDLRLVLLEGSARGEDNPSGPIRINTRNQGSMVSRCGRGRYSSSSSSCSDWIGMAFVEASGCFSIRTFRMPSFMVAVTSDGSASSGSAKLL